MADRLEVRVPKMGMDTTEVTIANWLVSQGDPVVEGTPLVELESEKTVFVLESEAAGEVLTIVQSSGATVPIGEVLCVLGRR